MTMTLATCQTDPILSKGMEMETKLLNQDETVAAQALFKAQLDAFLLMATARRHQQPPTPPPQPADPARTATVTASVKVQQEPKTMATITPNTLALNGYAKLLPATHLTPMPFNDFLAAAVAAAAAANIPTTSLPANATVAATTAAALPSNILPAAVSCTASQRAAQSLPYTTAAASLLSQALFVHTKIEDQVAPAGAPPSPPYDSAFGRKRRKG
ncbi:uncharacterized protein SPPG_08752 [Spizellomyces punctatus DAOM BR117]|uniref:Uncharacterized protein n=1 Tax=Spizellomyces punctatus (strain DAOM BR117) TaxID=645134 RepID=A0A0L0H507_SPIPD|nr:uncharacterized protein SPPG_08752 [Spizellomyces punctatus DAOM BR117]KNC95808.1 hypothetical protein SPPG_08752 [Spizellomyces punctatus DAOM BR117]|eukprot:XP_016603848.1 hypothetical protein SPPG_08752 [Spizellomyces punctatus DAOM BR117]